MNLSLQSLNINSSSTLKDFKLLSFMEVSLKMCIKKITKKLNEGNNMDIGLKRGWEGGVKGGKGGGREKRLGVVKI